MESDHSLVARCRDGLAIFLCIVLHELAHASVARLSGVPVRGITLLALGGIALIDKDATSPAREFWMAGETLAHKFKDVPLSACLIDR
jgi:Zn-dependent protease